MLETKPTVLARGVPAEERNGLYGLEEELIDGAAAGTPVVAVVVFDVDEVVVKTLAGETYPVVKIKHIEPLLSREAIDAAISLRDAAYKVRTGVDALDLPDVDDEGDD